MPNGRGYVSSLEGSSLPGFHSQLSVDCGWHDPSNFHPPWWIPRAMEMESRLGWRVGNAGRKPRNHQVMNDDILVGGFFTNPFEKICSSNSIISPGRGENKNCLKPPPSILIRIAYYVNMKISIYIPSRELTYPTLGKGKSSSKCYFWGIC